MVGSKLFCFVNRSGYFYYVLSNVFHKPVSLKIFFKLPRAFFRYKFTTRCINSCILSKLNSNRYFFRFSAIFYTRFKRSINNIYIYIYITNILIHLIKIKITKIFVTIPPIAHRALFTKWDSDV